MTEAELYDEAQPPRRGRRPGGKNKPGHSAGRRPKGSARRTEHTITLDPDLALLVQWHANARGKSVSESINILLGEALRNHTVDAEAQEVH